MNEPQRIVFPSLNDATYCFLAFSYPSDEASLRAFRRAANELEEVTVLRAHSPDETLFQIFVCYPEENKSIEEFDWGGVQTRMTVEQATFVLQRRMKEGIEAAERGDPYLSTEHHYDKDNPIMPG